MDENTLFLLVAVLLVIVILVGFLVYRGRSKASIQAGPFSMHFEGKGESTASNSVPSAPPPAGASPADVEVTNVKSTAGGAYISDTAGGRVRADQLEVQDDVIVSRSKQDNAPKV